ncbi:hypothetical protein [Paenirhodobacter populi]|uniref:TnsA endonuclease N-terminal domain-containing protein n=1 Tax=Paenirhodobacter populi TaxID=2306993 RepID=A0A443JN08_9RHOB|nr:hypothetical protein [Sinirhodobacter populi]RWR21890.1 hypothetical protein D2T30_07685 [Sinirhodobacter populi]
MHSQYIVDHDEWAYGQPKLKSAGKIELRPIPGVLPFTGVRNPLTTSSVSQKVTFKYRTGANNWQPKVGLAESLAELAVAHEALINPDIHDVEFQPLQFYYQRPDGSTHLHTIDLRITFRSGLRCLMFVRNSESLTKSSVKEEIRAIWRAAPAHEAHKFVVIDADAYSRARRDNLRRMHQAVAFEPDPEADTIVMTAATNLVTLWRVSDLFRTIDLSSGRIFRACLRLVACGLLQADMDAVICDRSRIWRVKA